MIFVKKSFGGRPDLFVRCDACGETMLCYKDQTDRVLAHYWIEENGWKTIRIDGQFKQLCKTCKEQYLQRKREVFFLRCGL